MRNYVCVNYVLIVYTSHLKSKIHHNKAKMLSFSHELNNQFVYRITDRQNNRLTTGISVGH